MPLSPHAQEAVDRREGKLPPVARVDSLAPALEPPANPVQEKTPKPAVVSPKPEVALRVLPCDHEGTVLEFCTSCNQAKAEAKHVRDCDLHERCVRGPTRDGKVTSCQTCLDYKAAADGGAT